MALDQVSEGTSRQLDKFRSLFAISVCAVRQFLVNFDFSTPTHVIVVTAHFMEIVRLDKLGPMCAWQ